MQRMYLDFDSEYYRDLRSVFNESSTKAWLDQLGCMCASVHGLLDEPDLHREQLLAQSHWLVARAGMTGLLRLAHASACFEEMCRDGYLNLPAASRSYATEIDRAGGSIASLLADLPRA